jgi:chromosome segregation protein
VPDNLNLQGTMRLSRIKIVGFKSFVDPTSVHFPGNLTGVVGPNGCGKSNIIDAVRWVMGEISAKHLRGDSMSDVIFNGSGGRKPVGTASVELVFDNSDGAISGAYASYAEVSLKRQVGRDGTSTYFINGSKCRRKDITQLFLGTGLGSRSYAIIEQGMISRLIEAKPDDMRAFLEEAAGISKYKERRRETESRIAHTRENLDRLNDLREEVEKQIRHLQRQASVARRFREHKELERRLHAELLALKLNELDSDVTGKDALVRERDTALQASLADLRSIEAEIERARSLHTERNDVLTAVQARYYQAGAEASRVEQSLQHAREMRQRQRTDLEGLGKALVESNALLARDQLQVDELTASLANAEPELESARTVEQASYRVLQETEAAMQSWLQGWEEFSVAAAEASRKTMVERTRIEQLELRLARQLAHRDRLEADRKVLENADAAAQLAGLESNESAARMRNTEMQASLRELLERIPQSREHETKSSHALEQARHDLQDCRGRLVSLEALQRAALGQADGKVVEWLAGHGLERRPRLAQELEVEHGWERAVETVLGSYLEAVVVDGIDAVSELVGGLKTGGVTFVGGTATASGSGRSRALAAKVQSPAAARMLLAGVSAVETLAEALSLRANLGPGESVITREGVWIGPNWLRVNRDPDERAGVIEREHEIRGLRDAVQAAQLRVSASEQGLENARLAIRELEDRRESLQAAVNESHREHSSVRGQLDAHRSRAEQSAQRLERVKAERAEADQAIASDESDIREARQRLEAGLAEMQALNDRRGPLEQERDKLRHLLGEARGKAQADVAAAQQVAIRVESQRSTLASVINSLERARNQVSQFQARQAELQQQLASADSPIEQLDRQLKEMLAARIEIDKELTEARRSLEEADAHIREQEQRRIAQEATVGAAREALEQVRMGVQEARVRRESLLEQFAATRLDLDEVRGQVPAEATVEAWEVSLAEVTARIERLGAVNLASIDELKEQTERKEYLDKQFADLTEALSTLDEAIRKIDKVTRSRFQDTYDRVNTGLKEKFPRLFGGGSAYLELVGDDALSAGVAVMARPPGKRNATISQLSGGEKALTAVALVFAIFELNPAPFCLLDEVDAPLDDHNVGRFCDIVRDMAERVQFIFITHNKSTMELAQQLIGVTMHEPGVSRLVAVDVDEAVRMAAS